MEGAFSGQLPFLLMMFGIIFFFMILPQQRRAKKEKNFKNNLNIGDRVITKFGVHGKIVEVNDQNDSCVIETMAGKLKMERSFVSLELSQKVSTQNKKQ
jgi:preprotein translocase subunit YajC